MIFQIQGLKTSRGLVKHFAKNWAESVKNIIEFIFLRKDNLIMSEISAFLFIDLKRWKESLLAFRGFAMGQTFYQVLYMYSFNLYKELMRLLSAAAVLRTAPGVIKSFAWVTPLRKWWGQDLDPGSLAPATHSDSLSVPLPYPWDFMSFLCKATSVNTLSGKWLLLWVYRDRYPHVHLAVFTGKVQCV